jgi:hypothetical protein
LFTIQAAAIPHAIAAMVDTKRIGKKILDAKKNPAIAVKVFEIT